MFQRTENMGSGFLCLRIPNMNVSDDWDHGLCIFMFKNPQHAYFRGLGTWALHFMLENPKHEWFRGLRTWALHFYVLKSHTWMFQSTENMGSGFLCYYLGPRIRRWDHSSSQLVWNSKMIFLFTIMKLYEIDEESLFRLKVCAISFYFWQVLKQNYNLVIT